MYQDHDNTYIDMWMQVGFEETGVMGLTEEEMVTGLHQPHRQN